VNRNIFIITLGMLLIAVCFTAGCQEPVIEVDPEDLNLIDHYVEELTHTLLDVEPDLLGWVREPYAENFPLKYNEERIILLAGHLEKISRIREKRQAETFPPEEIIAKWQVIVVRGSDEWLLEGPVIIEALGRLEELSDRVEQSIKVIIDSEGSLDEAQSENIIALIEELSPTIEDIRAVFYK
jgi:hypothetical protein